MGRSGHGEATQKGNRWSVVTQRLSPLGWMTSHKDIGIPDAGQHHVDEEGDDGVARQHGGRGARQKEGRGEGNERLNTHLCLLAAVRK